MGANRALEQARNSTELCFSHGNLRLHASHYAEHESLSDRFLKLLLTTLIIGPITDLDWRDMSTSSTEAESQSLQQKAVERVRSALGNLKDEDALFTQAQNQPDAVSEILKTLKQKYDGQHSKRRTNTIVRKFEQYTQWLQNFSEIVDTLAQTQAGIACPIWAPIKFVLQVR